MKNQILKQKRFNELKSKTTRASFFSALPVAALTIVAGTALVGCQDPAESTTTGNPVVALKLTGSSQAASYAALDSSFGNWLKNALFPSAQALPPPVMTDSSGTRAVTLSEFWMTVGEVEFKATETADAGEVEGADVEFQGPYTVDLFDSQPDILAQGPIGTDGLRRIRVKYVRTQTLPAGTPSGLNDKAVYLTGVVDGNSFTFTMETEVTFEVGGPNLVSLNSGNTVILQVETASLISKIDLSAVTNGVSISETNRVSATNPCPTIDAGANDLFTCFEKGIETQSRLGKDSDDDGELEIGDDTVD